MCEENATYFAFYLLDLKAFSPVFFQTLLRFFRSFSGRVFCFLLRGLFTFVGASLLIFRCFLREWGLTFANRQIYLIFWSIDVLLSFSDRSLFEILFLRSFSDSRGEKSAFCFSVRFLLQKHIVCAIIYNMCYNI